MPRRAENAQSAIPESKAMFGSWPAGPPDTDDSHQKGRFDQSKVAIRARCSINWFLACKDLSVTEIHHLVSCAMLPLEERRRPRPLKLVRKPQFEPVVMAWLGIL
ncbi:hypothetical protein MGG_16976 [Pyricularia oryzae 70-15]|uniref:Uncharacterized protein n=1 Tax=Pyricularia oryzae (strain 70-15 / ATCC MYA-4617 / FGSC 8958) TaxID=242507 RepID=G4N2V7_PYRO7|nr:uncharacterized protein MGG_16976 [Pyricularia oryzae 70-15]EHA53406.1 hypothetical protein MGG_16976 [Pyricularia oryzae 70-15]